MTIIDISSLDLQLCVNFLEVRVKSNIFNLQSCLTFMQRWAFFLTFVKRSASCTMLFLDYVKRSAINAMCFENSCKAQCILF